MKISLVMILEESDANGDDEDNEKVTEAEEDISGSESDGENDSDTDDEDSDEDISEAGEDVSGSESAGRENVSFTDDEYSESISEDGEDVSGRESAGRENNDADTDEDRENVSEAGGDILGSKYAGEAVVTMSKKRKGGPGGYGKEQVKKFVYRKSGEAGSGDEDMGDELVSSLKSDYDAHMKLVIERAKKLAEKEAMYHTLNGKNEEGSNKLRQANEALPTVQEALNNEKQRANQLTSEVESWKKKFEEAEQLRQSERIRAEGAEKKLNEAPKKEQIIEEFKKSEEFKDAVVVECTSVFKTIVERRWLFYKDDLNRPFSEWADFEAKLKADGSGSKK